MTLVGVDNGDGTSGGNRDRSAKLQGDLGGTIVIKKLTDPASDTTAVFGFTGSGGITPTSFNLKNGGTETFVSVAPGTYTVTESTVPAGWALTNLVCVDPTGNSTTNLGMSKATIDVASGETITCTFTNTQAGTLTVTKVTIPDDTTTGFPITASGTGTISGSPTQTVKTGAPVTYTVTPGTYAVSETPPAGWTQTGNTCTTVTVTAGQSASCTITNTQAATTLTVTKVTIPDDTTTGFPITASGTGTISGSPTQTVKTGAPVTYTVTPGTYAVSETPPAGWTQTGNTCTTVTVTAGQSASCTITNTRAATTLTVTKVTIPDDTTTGFPITASGTGTISGSPTQTVKTGAPVTYTVTPGTYAVSETPPAGWTQTGNTCTTVTVTAGQSASCTITNTQVLPGHPCSSSSSTSSTTMAAPRAPPTSRSR
jgi:hypothetical protein